MTVTFTAPAAHLAAAFGAALPHISTNTAASPDAAAVRFHLVRNAYPDIDGYVVAQASDGTTHGLAKMPVNAIEFDDVAVGLDQSWLMPGVEVKRLVGIWRKQAKAPGVPIAVEVRIGDHGVTFAWKNDSTGVPLIAIVRGNPAQADEHIQAAISDGLDNQTAGWFYVAPEHLARMHASAAALALASRLPIPFRVTPGTSPDRPLLFTSGDDFVGLVCPPMSRANLGDSTLLWRGFETPPIRS